MSEAIFGLVGVLVGSFIPWIKEELLEMRQRAQQAKYLAIQIVCVLDEYVEKCVEVVSDDGTICGQAAVRDENGQEYYEPQVPLPEPPAYPNDVVWKSIDSGLMYRLLSLPNESKYTDRYIDAAGEHTSPPDYGELFEARHEGYADLGLVALRLSKELRDNYKIPERNWSRWNSDWNPEQYFADKKKKIEQRRESSAASCPLMNSTLHDRRGNEQ